MLFLLVATPYLRVEKRLESLKNLKFNNLGKINLEKSRILNKHHSKLRILLVTKNISKR